MPDHTLDAYVFVPSGSQGAMESLVGLWGAGHIRYATQVLSGGYGSVAFLEASLAEGDVAALGDLKVKLTAVRDQVNPGTSVGVAVATGTRAPTRWSEKSPIGAYIRIRTERGAARSVFEALDGRHGANDQFGIALVAGDFDVLVEINADTLSELREWIEDINAVEGIVATDSAIVLTDKYEPARPGAA